MTDPTLNEPTAHYTVTRHSGTPVDQWFSECEDCPWRSGECETEAEAENEGTRHELNAWKEQANAG